MQTQCNIRKKKNFDCVRTIRPSVTMYTLFITIQIYAI